MRPLRLTADARSRGRAPSRDPQPVASPRCLAKHSNSCAYQSDLRVWQPGLKAICGSSASRTASCSTVGGSRVLADPVRVRAIGRACSPATHTLRRRRRPSRDRLVVVERLIRLGGACRLRRRERRLARRSAAIGKASARLAHALGLAHPSRPSPASARSRCSLRSRLLRAEDQEKSCLDIG